MKKYILLTVVLIISTLTSFTLPDTPESYSILGNWKIVDMQFEGAKESKNAESMRKALAQSNTRFVFLESGQFTMVLGPGGRGISGGYYYDAESNILSIKYGSHTDTALVSWESADKMVHASKDGKVKTKLERVRE
ncbi:hypothetical protein [Pontibacter harenae]|uniref:hypothetical protein n=1 Tax=Pontibacter harenae TaxID=2894083 RepID=UPI001E283222|nr:hypothetical protein [Pontibacter harenae]MCC9166746.1 hypothetical protein [Pontibacter harenae]